jgi:hypothetical protein
LTTNWLRNLGQWLLFGGSTKLRPYERSILKRAAAELEEADSATLLQQVESFDRVQRSLNDRMVMFHFRLNSAPASRMAVIGDAHCVAKLKLRGKSGRSNAAVISHQGLLSSLEFSRPPKALFAQGVDVVEVTRDGAWRGLAEAADRLEHGSES